MVTIQDYIFDCKIKKTAASPETFGPFRNKCSRCVWTLSMLSWTIVNRGLDTSSGCWKFWKWFWTHVRGTLPMDNCQQRLRCICWMLEVLEVVLGTCLGHPHAIFLCSTSAVSWLHYVLTTTPRGFEPLRAEPNGFRVHPLSRSGTVSAAAT